MPEPEKSFGEKILGFFVKEEAPGNATPGGVPAGNPALSPLGNDLAQVLKTTGSLST